eukprot:GHVN01095349.1.p1 GENE.GHVN01095349.1~~GHVN01095349.1.p1  ORF type:complete len:1225 (+),score=195.88 GHVN01095349.1:276-3950(+)
MSNSPVGSSWLAPACWPVLPPFDPPVSAENSQSRQPPTGYSQLPSPLFDSLPRVIDTHLTSDDGASDSYSGGDTPRSSCSFALHLLSSYPRRHSPISFPDSFCPQLKPAESGDACQRDQETNKSVEVSVPLPTLYCTEPTNPQPPTTSSSPVNTRRCLSNPCASHLSPDTNTTPQKSISKYFSIRLAQQQSHSSQLAQQDSLDYRAQSWSTSGEIGETSPEGTPEGDDWCVSPPRDCSEASPSHLSLPQSGSPQSRSRQSRSPLPQSTSSQSTLNTAQPTSGVRQYLKLPVQKGAQRSSSQTRSSPGKMSDVGSPPHKTRSMFERRGDPADGKTEGPQATELENNFTLSDPLPSSCTTLTERTRHLIRDVDVRDAVRAMKEGDDLLKHCANPLRKPHYRRFWVDMNNLALKWVSPKKKTTKSQIFLSSVHRILLPSESDFWGTSKKSRSEKSGKGGASPSGSTPTYGIEVVSAGRRLNVECDTEEQWKMWIAGLHHVHQKALTRKDRNLPFVNDFIRRQWELSDADKRGRIQYKELVEMLKRLNYTCDARYVSNILKEFDVDGSQVLEYDEFRTMLETLMTQPVVQELMNKYGDGPIGTDCMTLEGYQRFLLEVQKCPTSQIEEELAHIRELKEPFFRDNLLLTNVGFNMVLLSTINSAIQPKRQTVYQDMSLPLSEYWIASSHNTYLTADQLVGRSAVSQYIDALLKGCRCVELDCWDGPENEPVVYHGHTLTSKILLESVVQVCKDYAFLRSPFPVVLSLENHCSFKQKAKIGQIFSEVLGESIYRHPPGKPLPSPKELKGYFLIKGKIPDSLTGIEVEEGDEEDLRLEEMEMGFARMEIEPDNVAVDSSACPPPVSNRRASVARTRRASVTGGSSEDDGTPVASRSASVSVLVGNSLTPTDRTSLLSYYDAISLTGRKWKNKEVELRNKNDICSLNEQNFYSLEKKCAKEGLVLSEFTKKFLFRIYPSGTRLMSSNFDPTSAWNHGAHMVALNYQALGISMLLNLGRFTDNGGCGYVLKPQLLRSNHAKFNPDDPWVALERNNESGLKVTIKLLSAHQLPRPVVDNQRTNAVAGAVTRRKDVSCPFVIVSCHGLKCDQQFWKSTTVQNNGFNPSWVSATSISSPARTPQVLSFDIHSPSLSLIAFEVRHQGALTSEFLAASATPANCLRNGVRWIPLHDAKLRPIEWCGILAHISLELLPKKSRSPAHRNEKGNTPERAVR